MKYTNTSTKYYGPLTARILLSSVFIIGGFGMLLNFSGTAGYFSSVGIPLVGLFVVIVAVIQIVGGSMVATGIHSKEGAGALVVLTLLAVVVIYSGTGQLTQALASLSIVGGLLSTMIYGPGPINWKKKCPCPMCKTQKDISERE